VVLEGVFEKVSAEILIYAVVAAGLVVWLRNILGTRHGEERERENPFVNAGKPSNDDNKKSADSADRNAGATDAAGMSIGGLVGGALDITNIKDGLDKSMSIANGRAEQGLVEISKIDRNFQLKPFLRGAQDAFAFVVEAFADRDRDMLKMLLAPSVYKAFDAVLKEREKEGVTASVEIHSIRRSEVMEAKIVKNMAYITVRFTADETSILRDKEGEVTFGDPDRVTETIDIWTLGRKIKSNDPTWLLYETREDADDEVSGSTVPETEKS
jgi:predicted lipid-binding transport protein (Tim44 family)